MAIYQRPDNASDLSHNFGQIHPLMHATMARHESARCLFCHDAPCIRACPTEIDIPLFIRQISTGNVKGAARTIYASNAFGNICGKVCPTSVLCEGACVFNAQDEKPIEIGRLQSYATTHAQEVNMPLPTLAPENGKRIAIIGAGPAGIACACALREKGYAVDVFEAKDKPSGLTLYGVAPYKITNAEILQEIAYLQAQYQFEIQYDHPIRKRGQFQALEEKYDAVFLGIGLGETIPLQLPGEHLDHYWGAVAFIERVKTDPLNIEIGKHVVVIGGGNTAMDAAQESARLGAEKVTIAYRRNPLAMRAYQFEVDNTRALSVDFLFHATPVRVYGQDHVESVFFARTASKNGTLQIIPGSEFELKCDMVIRATGQEKMTSLLECIPGLEYDSSGRIKVNPQTGQTTHPKYFAGGDAVNGGKEVVNAIAEGKRAATGIDLLLSQRDHQDA